MDAIPHIHLQGLAATVPATAYRQSELYSVFEKSPARHRLRPRSQSIMSKILQADNGITTRHLAMPDLDRIFDLDAEALNRAFEQLGPELAARALDEALEVCQLRAAEIDAVFVCTCTGYLCPGVSSHVAQRMGLRSGTYLHDLVGMGCGAAIPALRAAHGFAALHPDARVAVIAVEICSAAFYLDDDPGVLISACLFGDGAACAILSGPAAQGVPPWRMDHYDTLHLPGHRESLRFGNASGKLRNQLARSVPTIAASAVRQLHDRSGERVRNRDHSTYHLAHPGGRDVVDALCAAFPGLDFPESRWILRHGGNLSSPSILFALGCWLSRTPFAPRVRLPESWQPDRPATPTSAQHLWLTTFGAGFSAHSCSLIQS